MGDIVNLHQLPIDGERRREFICDLARFADGILSEKQVRKKYRLADAVWDALADDDALVEEIEAEKIRRIRDGSSKREKAQLLVVQAPDVLSGILLDASANPRHRIDSAQTLNSFAANGPEAAAASDRFVITINMGGDVEHYSKSIEVNPHDVDPTARKIPIAAIDAGEKRPKGRPRKIQLIDAAPKRPRGRSRKIQQPEDNDDGQHL